MRILAISDVDSWAGYEAVLKKCAPDVVALCGDLVEDGSTLVAGTSPRKHQEGFYRFLKRAGVQARVLVVSGNHDKAPAYDADRINNMPGCEELSGRSISIGGITFLGVGYHQAHLIADLAPLLDAQRCNVDVVLSHCEGRRLERLSTLSPRLIVQGHFGVGTFHVYGTPTVFISDANYALIEMKPNRKSALSVRVDYRKSHLPIKAFVRHSSLSPFGEQAKHSAGCYRCNPPLMFESRKGLSDCSQD